MENNLKIGGVYAIIRRVENMQDKYYVGSSNNMHHRWQAHLSQLRRGMHYNKHLQRSWGIYGEAAFIFIVLETVADESLLFQREQYWINTYNAYDHNRGYNILPTAGSHRGYKLSDEHKAKLSKAFSGSNNPFYGKKHDEETRNRMSQNHPDINGEKNPFYGMTHNQEAKLIISKSNKGKKLSEQHKEILSQVNRGENSPHSKLNESEVNEIIELLKEQTAIAHIANIYGVSTTTISDIRKGKKWRHITGGIIVADAKSMAKIDKGIADQIRERHANGESRKSLANIFGLNETYLGKIIRFERWK